MAGSPLSLQNLHVYALTETTRQLTFANTAAHLLKVKLLMSNTEVDEIKGMYVYDKYGRKITL